MSDHKKVQTDTFCSDPLFVGEELYNQMGFLFSQFWPIDKIIVESFEWYH